MIQRLMLILLSALLLGGCRGRQVREDGPVAEARPSDRDLGQGEPEGIVPTDDLPITTLDLSLDHEDSIAFAQAWHLDSLPMESYEIPVVVNDEVIRWMVYFTSAAQGTFERWLSRSGQWRDLMELALVEEGMPPELFYLSMIESGFNVDAVSRSKACGLWQFMAPTGRQMQLCVDRYLDERFDPELSTKAAARYLRYLFDRFGDWHLTLAAYNGGEGRVGAAMKRTGLTDFWSLCRADALPRETCDYVPRFLAALVLSENHLHFGFDVEMGTPWEYETVQVPGGVALELVADCAGAECAKVEALNPQLRRPFTPPGGQAYAIRVPRGGAEGFAERFAAIPKEQLKGAIHVIESGETLSHIARRYGVTVDELMRANGIKDPRRLQIGQELTVPGTVTVAKASSGSGAASRPASPQVSAPKAPPPSRPSGPSTVYTVVGGDSLWGISNRYGVSVAELKTWNGLKGDGLQAGQKLRIYGSFGTPGGTHTVKSGDSLWAIARAYGVSVEQLRAWNGLASDKLSIGQVLKVGPEGLAQRSPGNGSNVIYHTVAPGESLWSVAQQYGVDVPTLRRINNLRSDTLYPGDRLRLSP